MADFNHTDYTAELNRIIVALTSIRDDIRLIRARGESGSTGLVINKVMNPMETALMQIAMGPKGAANAWAASQRVSSVTESGAAIPGGAPAGGEAGAEGEAGEQRDAIVAALGADPTKGIFRENALYYYEAAPTAGPDDGLRGSAPVPQPYVADGGVIGYHDLGSNTPKPGSPPSADVLDFGASKKRWPAERQPSQVCEADGLFGDILNSITGQVVGKFIEAIQQEIETGGASTSTTTQVGGSQGSEFKSTQYDWSDYNNTDGLDVYDEDYSA